MITETKDYLIMVNADHKEIKNDRFRKFASFLKSFFRNDIISGFGMKIEPILRFVVTSSSQMSMSFQIITSTFERMSPNFFFKFDWEYLIDVVVEKIDELPHQKLTIKYFLLMATFNDGSSLRFIVQGIAYQG
jgi:hypothetical protein